MYYRNSIYLADDAFALHNHVMKPYPVAIFHTKKEFSITDYQEAEM